MSETQTSHEPTPAELAHASNDPASPDHAPATGDHAADAHSGDGLGPVDVRAWGALILGVAAGLLVVLCLVITTRLLVPVAA